MTRKEYTDGVRKELQEMKQAVDETILKKAIDKAARHARNKYGSADWDAEVAESDFANGRLFYAETLRNPAGTKTWNRDVYNNSRRGY